jgi:hypothetical protein
METENIMAMTNFGWVNCVIFSDLRIKKIRIGKGEEQEWYTGGGGVSSFPSP